MRLRRTLAAFAAAAIAVGAMGAAAASSPAPDRVPVDLPDAASVQPRDLVVDQRGLGYLRAADGTLTPHGHSVAASRPISPRAPGGRPGPPGSGGGGGDVVTFDQWGFGGQVQQSAGRILFEMGDSWYVCSGTVIDDGDTPGRSIILTAAHCVYDDVDKAFARTAVFIPNQADGNDRTDFDCSNDPEGCWVLDHGVVDVNWTTSTFPDNIPWDYGYYVVSDIGSHSTTDFSTLGNVALDAAVGTMAASFSPPTVGDMAHALGYSYDVDPDFMYCKEALGTNGSANYWLGRCDMSGGSSGGPWVQPMNEASGTGPVFSVNSWGYTFQAGMAGPKLHGTSASTLYAIAKSSALSGVGVVVGGSTTTTSSSSTTTTTVAATEMNPTSQNNGGTWTATVTGPDGLEGTFDGAAASCTTATCTLSGIPKRTGSVTFTATAPAAVAGQSISVAKP